MFNLTDLLVPDSLVKIILLNLKFINDFKSLELAMAGRKVSGLKWKQKAKACNNNCPTINNKWIKCS